ncbi:ABC transporter ATP-binding protein, partial [Candidatus Sumerlaeota bacterium]|nr:ABC transporter ATP-binding protein [Candidatus Sumerlaeota bacterium]
NVTFVGDNEALIGLNQKMFLAGVPIISIGEQQANLEEMFMKITTGAVN